MSRRHSKSTAVVAQQEGRPLAVVISSGAPFGAYDIVRSLGIGGIRSVVVSSNPSDMSFHSKYSIGQIVCPEFLEGNHPAILDTLLRLSEECPLIPVLYYASDPELTFVWKYREKLSSAYHFLLPPDRLFERMMDKTRFVDLAQEYCLSIPQTLVIQNGSEIVDAIHSITFPCIVKPAVSHDWIWESDEQRSLYGPYKTALRRFTERDELISFCEGLPRRDAGFLVQSYIDGRDETISSFHGYFDEKSSCLAYFVGRKIRTYPAHTGGSVYIQTIQEESLARASMEHLQRMGYRGIAKIDYKWDPHNQTHQYLEINPRYNLWQLLGAYAGVNLSAIAYQHQSGIRVESNGHYEVGARLLFLKQDLRAYLQYYRKSGEWSLREYLRSFSKKKTYRVFSLSDPVPFLYSSLSFLVRQFARLLERTKQVFARVIPFSDAGTSSDRELQGSTTGLRRDI